MSIEKVFLLILNMGLTASYVIAAIILLRLLLKKTPKWIMGVLWVIASFRLIFPFSFESVLSIFSVIPDSEISTTEILQSEAPKIHSGIPFMNSTINPVISESVEQAVDTSMNPMLIISIIWLTGVAVLLIYSIVTYIKFKRKISTATILQDNVYQSENIASPFLLGFIKPRIYIPYTLSEPELSHVIAHENAHIVRRDYLLKPLAFIILTLHWFNPVVWIAYLLFCRDIEIACDERVIKDMAVDERKSYSKALLSLAVQGRKIAVCPLAFGEVSVKDRVKNTLSYKKPVFWIIIAALIVCAVTAVCLLTNPIKDSDAEDINTIEDISQLYGTYHPDEVVYVNPLSSFYPFDLDYSPYYTFDENRITIVTPSFSNEDDSKIETIDAPLYTRLQITKDEFEEMFIIDKGRVDISQYENIEQIILSDRYSLFVMDSDLWFANFNGENIWIIYNLQPSNLYSPAQLTMDDLEKLVQEKGEDLTWSDFEKYIHSDIGSGIYIWQVPIDIYFCVIVSGFGPGTEPMSVHLNRLSSDGNLTGERLELLDKNIDIQGFVADTSQYLIWVMIPTRSSVFPALPISIDMEYDKVDVTVNNGSLYIHGTGETRHLGKEHTYMYDEIIYWSPSSKDTYEADDVAASCELMFNVKNAEGDIISNGQINIQQISETEQSGYTEYKVLLADTSNDLKLDYDVSIDSWGSFIIYSSKN